MFLTSYQSRSCTFTITVNDADGVAVVFVTGDVMRVKIGRNGDTPVLDFDSVAAGAGGSTVSSANPTTLVLDQDDMDIAPGVYDIEVSIVDDSDQDRIKHAEKGVLVVHQTQAGDIGLT